MARMQLTDDIRKAVRAQLTAKPKRGVQTRHIVKGNPWAGGFKSAALGVDPSQITEAREALLRSGVACEFCPKTGDAILTSDEHRRKVARACGLWNGRDGYGVPGSQEGHYVATGREQVRAREEFKRRILSDCDD